MADIDVDLPYAATGGWKNRPNRSTPWNATAGNKYNAAISLIKNQANLALETALAGGGGGGSVSAADVIAILASNKFSPTVLQNADGTWPNRPSYPWIVIWRGSTPPTIRTDGVTTGGTPQAVQTTTWTDEWKHSTTP